MLAMGAARIRSDGGTVGRVRVNCARPGGRSPPGRGSRTTPLARRPFSSIEYTR